MSALRGTLITCDACGDCDNSSSFPEGSAAEVRRDLRTDGWHVRPGGRDICPDCWNEGAR